MKNKICSLARVGKWQLIDPLTALGRFSEASGVVTPPRTIAIKQVGHAIFAQREHQLRRRRSRRVDEGGAATTKISVGAIERLPN